MLFVNRTVRPRAVFLGLAMLVVASVCSAAQASQSRIIFATPTGHVAPDRLAARLLASHNRERAARKVPALRWDPGLAASAASYGPALSALGGLRHSPRANRPGQAENLWMGTRGAFSPEQMVGSWIEERKYFRAGVFPNTSTTGNWLAVGHYSQLIWRGTTAVGCAVHRDAHWEFLICRYSPKGNIDGAPVS